MNKLTLVSIGAILSAAAFGQQQTIRQVPGVDGVYVVSPPAPSSTDEYAYLRDAGKQSFATAGQAIGSDVSRALNPRPRVAHTLILAVTCGSYTKATYVYSNGFTRDVAIDPMPASDSALDVIRAAVRPVLVVTYDAPCPDASP